MNQVKPLMLLASINHNAKEQLGDMSLFLEVLSSKEYWYATLIITANINFVLMF
jgi:hypothetical protein